MRTLLRSVLVTMAVWLTLGLGSAAFASGGGDEGGAEYHACYSCDDDHDGTANWMDDDSGDYVASSVAFHGFNLILFIGLIYFGAGASINDAVRGRALTIKRDISEAATVRDEAQARHDEVSGRLARLERELAEMAERTKAEAAAEEKSLRERADANAQRIATTAQQQIRDEANRARLALRRDAVEIAVKLAEGILTEAVQPADQRRLASEFLDTIKGEDSHV